MQLNNYLEKEELKYVLEALCFSVSVDICAKWNNEDYNKMLLLIEKLSNEVDEKIKLNNIYLLKNAIFDDKKIVNKLKKFVKIKSK